MKPGRTVTVCAGDVYVVSGVEEKLVAIILVTIMTVGGRRDTLPSPTEIPMRDRGAGGASPATGWCPCSRVRVICRRIHDLVAR